uniref:Transmembrane 4 L six family member 5 n=1 Tax=Anolis carolinensis TaxID=28377 RepID=A0A803TPH7_ANOCA
MLRSVFCSLFGGLGAFYCLAVASAALAKGPYCQTHNQKWGYPFEDLGGSYLQNKTQWEACVTPPRVVLWHMVLFSLLLGLGLLELLLCGIQVVNGLLGTVCGDCRKAGDREGVGVRALATIGV